MKAHGVRSSVSVVALRATAALVILLLSAVSSRAQTLTAPRLSSSQAASEQRARIAVEQDQRDREWNMRHMEDRVVTSEEELRLLKQQQQLIVAQVSKDYRVIQELNNEVMRTNAAPGVAAFDYRQIAHHTAEINRRAARLKQYLALPRLDDEDAARSTYTAPALDETRAWLALLDTRIASFVANPVFKNLHVVDAEHSARASRDLRDIIELSSLIKRNAERLNKLAKD